MLYTQTYTPSRRKHVRNKTQARGRANRGVLLFDKMYYLYRITVYIVIRTVQALLYFLKRAAVTTGYSRFRDTCVFRTTAYTIRLRFCIVRIHVWEYIFTRSKNKKIRYLLRLSSFDRVLTSFVRIFTRTTMRAFCRCDAVSLG